MNPVIDLAARCAELEDYWSPKVVGETNGQLVKVAKLKGAFVWHKHDEEDELFLVVKGALTIQYEGGRSVTIPAGAFHVVPRNTMHNPFAADECWIALIEPMATKHTGDVVSERTRSLEDQLR